MKSILTQLEAYIESGKSDDEFIELIKNELHEQAKTKFMPHSTDLTEEAINEAQQHGFDPKQYKNILMYLGSDNNQLLIQQIENAINEANDPHFNLEEYKIRLKEAKNDENQLFIQQIEDAIEKATPPDHQADFNLEEYKTILQGLKTRKENLFVQQIKQRCERKREASVSDLEKAYKDHSIAQLVALYPTHKEKMDIEKLLLLTPISVDSDSQTLGTNLDRKLPAYPAEERLYRQSTFVHELFHHNAAKKDIISFFKALDRLSESNPELMENYLNLSNHEGKSIKQLVLEKSLTQKYLGIEQEIFMRNQQVAQRYAIDTHTKSVHGSVDQSLVRLAYAYDSNSVEVKDNARYKANITRTDKWNHKIQTDLDALKTRLQGIIANEHTIDEFISPTLVPGDNQAEECAKFKFYAETALRLIDGLNKPRYGNPYTVHSNEPVSCGLTPREIAAIGYASLSTRASWHNPNNEIQQFMTFIEHLYVAKRGYNIDDHGEDEWKQQPPRQDNNKCTGGTVNEIAYGLQDHKDVAIRIVTPETMRSILATMLPEILERMSTDETNVTLINNWLWQGMLNHKLTSQIIRHLQENAQFNQEFSHDEIANIGVQALNSLDNQQFSGVRKKLCDKLPKQFSAQNPAIADQGLVYNFVFNERQGFVLYLENLYHIDRNSFITTLESTLSAGIGNENLDSNETKKVNVMLSLLLASENQDMVHLTKAIFNEHLNNIRSSQQDKDQMFILESVRRNHSLCTTVLELGADVNAQDMREGHEGLTALYYAVTNGNIVIVQKLIEHGANVEVRDRQNLTLLRVAVAQDNVDIIQALLAAGADANAKDQYDRTSLHYAADRNKTDIVSVLIKAGADVNARDNEGKTPLCHVTVGYNADYRDKLHVDVMQELIKAGADVNARDNQGFTSLHQAARRNNYDVIPVLIAAGADASAKDQYDRTPLHYAAPVSDIIVQLLLEAGANIEAIDSEGKTPLHYAVRNSGIIVQLLLKAGAKIEAIDSEGKTPLHEAVNSDHAIIVQLLLKAGANIEAIDSEGKTSLHYAAAEKNVDVMRALLEEGANIEAKDTQGKTPLHNAVGRGRKAIAQLLLEKSADIEAIDNEGLTPLHYAIKKGNAGMVAQLIDYRAKFEFNHDVNSMINNISDGQDKAEVIKTILIHLIKRSNDSIPDSSDDWRAVEQIVKNLPRNKQVKIVANVLKAIDNSDRRERLLGFLPKAQQIIVNANTTSTISPSARNVTALIQRDSNDAVSESKQNNRTGGDRGR